MKNSLKSKDKPGICEYDLAAPPARAPDVMNWGFPTPDHQDELVFKDPPPIGTRVFINFNGLGHGTVEAYFYEHKYIGVRVKLEEQPAWHRKQNPGRDFALVFAREIEHPKEGA